MTQGVFPETLSVAKGVNVYGGYDALWQRSPSHVTKITGGSAGGNAEGVVANSVNATTTLQLLTLAPGAPSALGGSSYGLRGLGSTGLVLDHVTVIAAQVLPATAARTAPRVNREATEKTAARGGTWPEEVQSRRSPGRSRRRRRIRRRGS